MDTSDTYRKMAAELKAKAAGAQNARLASEWANLARCYLRLAEQADSNNLQDIWLEFGPRSSAAGDDNVP